MIKSMKISEMKNVEKWLVNPGGLMMGNQIIYIATTPDGTKRIVARQGNPESPATYVELTGDSWDNFPEYNVECYVYGRRIEN